MKAINIRLRESTIEWLKEMANNEKVALSTMIRLLLEREEFRDEIEKQFDKKKRGK